MPPLFGAFVLLLCVIAASIPAGLVLAVPCNQIARRLGYSPVWFTALSLVPLFNFLFFFLVGVLVLLHILDRLNAIDATVKER